MSYRMFNIVDGMLYVGDYVSTKIVATIIRLTREIGLQTFILGFVSIIPNMIIIFKPDEVEKNCIYAMASLFTIYILFIIAMYYKVIIITWYYRHIRADLARYISDISKNFVDWISSLISLAMQIIYLLGKNDQNNIIYVWVSQVIPLTIVFLMTTFILKKKLYNN